MRAALVKQSLKVLKRHLDLLPVPWVHRWHNTVDELVVSAILLLLGGLKLGGVKGGSRQVD
jgi:hypothetical protein